VGLFVADAAGDTMPAVHWRRIEIAKLLALIQSGRVAKTQRAAGEITFKYRNGGIAIASLSTTFPPTISRLGPAVCRPMRFYFEPILYIFLTRPKAIKFVHKSVTLSQRIAACCWGTVSPDSHELIDIHAIQ